MVNAVTLQIITVMIAGASVVIGVVIGVIQLRDMKRTRQAQLFMQIYDRFNEMEFQKLFNYFIFQWEWKDFDDFSKKYGAESNPEAFASRASLVQFFEGAGVLVKQKLIDIKLVESLIGIQLLWVWEKFGPIVKEFRKRSTLPRGSRQYEEIEYLYNEIKKINDH